MPMVIAKRLVVAQEKGELLKLQIDQPLSIKGTEGMVVHFSECCQPIPGDSIIGIFQKGQGIQVHTSECPIFKKNRSNPEQIVPLRWDENVKGEFWVDIIVDVVNKKGVLALLATSISESDSNIGNISVDPRDGSTSTVTFSVSVLSRKHLARLMRRLRSNSVVVRLVRKKIGE